MITTIEEQEKIDLSEVFYDLDHAHLIRSKRENSLLKKFANLLASKSSFASRTHTWFSNLLNKNSS